MSNIDTALLDSIIANRRLMLSNVKNMRASGLSWEYIGHWLDRTGILAVIQLEYQDSVSP